MLYPLRGDANTVDRVINLNMVHPIGRSETNPYRQFQVAEYHPTT
jgi:hypothetical protein